MNELPDFNCDRTIHRLRQAVPVLTRLTVEQRHRALQQFLNTLEQQSDALLEANTLDLEASREMAVSETIQNWLKLTPERLQVLSRQVQRILTLPDPLTQRSAAGLPLLAAQTYHRAMPLGVIALIYEALPTLPVLMAAMALKTGNCLLLRGGSEASHSNLVVMALLDAVGKAADLPQGWLVALPCEPQVPLKDLLSYSAGLDLIIPYGRPGLVQQVVHQAEVAVLPTVIGNCYLFWSASGDAELVRSLILDSHLGEPEAVNGIEKVLLHRQLPRQQCQQLFETLHDKGFELRGDEALSREFTLLHPARPEEWSQPYLRRVVAFRVVDDLIAAVSWMQRYSSAHADTIVTESYTESRQFARTMTSTGIYINTSPRFRRLTADPTASVALGMAHPKSPIQGPIGLHSLLRYQTVIEGDGGIHLS